MTRVDFLRHGETEAADALLGRTDAPLAAAGRAVVARQVAGRTWSSIVSSPLARARESAAVAAAATGAAVECDPDWREMDFGEWDGTPRATLAGEAGYAAFYRDPDRNPPPAGEAAAALRARVTSALQRLAARGPGPVLVVAHGGSIRMALAVLLGLPLERLWAVRLGCGARLTVEMGNDPAHGLWGEIVEIVQPAPEPHACPEPGA